MMDDVVSATHSTHVLCCGHSASSYGIEGEPANAEAVVNTQDDALLLKSSQQCSGGIVDGERIGGTVGGFIRAKVQERFGLRAHLVWGLTELEQNLNMVIS
eukprot:scaffold17831_cov164-Skeletonema_marinoi.AAC.6